MPPTAETKARFYATTLDAETNKAAVKRMRRDKVTKSELTRRALAAYLGQPVPLVKTGRPAKDA